MHANLTDGMWAGFVATVYLSLVLLAKARLAGPRAIGRARDIPEVVAAFSGARLPSRAGWIGLFLVGSLFWGVAYALLQPWLPGEPWVRGATFGALVWLAVMAVFMPLAGQGTFGKTMGVRAILASLILNLLYGAILGYAYAY